MDPIVTSTESTDLLGFPKPATWNTTQHLKLDDLKMDSNMAWLIGSLVTAICWVIYITFYNSRVFGCIITKIVNRLFIKGAYFKIGSFTINPLAGKIMFRDVVFINFDYTVRIQDGYIIFRWWRSYVPKDVSEDLSHSDTRLSIMLNGLELHVYNRSDIYAQLERTFGLRPSILIPNENMSAEEAARIREETMNVENQRQCNTERDAATQKVKKKQRPEAMAATTWRDLIPVIKFEICSGRFVFGNRLTPTTLSICVEEAHCVYSTKPAVSRLDHFMHFIKARAENSKVLLAPSPKYTGLVDDPPRYMGEGFVVMMSNLLELYFYMDEPGIVPEEPVVITLANGDVVEAAPPVWGLDIKCGKATNFSYGPWADRQRDHLFKFFYPPDWQMMQITQPPKAGERRQYQSFDISLCTINDAVIDILFSKNKETNAVHVNIGPGTYLEVTIPWITLQDGFTTKITGQLLHVEATTSLQYRSLAECETLQFTIKVHYPLKWNDHQDWIINLTGSKATAFFVYNHIDFFQDLIEDWASKMRPDILTFMPYTWKFAIILKEFELITISNEFNWIDCSSTNQENHHLAFCGDLADVSFNLPFDDFLPQTVPLKFWIHGEGLDLSMYLPEISTSRPILLGIDANARILVRDGQIKRRSELLAKRWRRICLPSTGWVDCWSVPILALAIQYVYHPMPPLGPDPQADITTPEKEEILLSPLKIPKMKKSPAMPWSQCDSQRFDPSSLPPDLVAVELEIGSSILMAYGSVLRNFVHLKENIFGEDQTFTDMETSNTKMNSSKNVKSSNQKDDHQNTTTKSLSEASLSSEEKPKRFDPRYYRPLEVTVSVTIHDIQAHLMKNCNENDPPCPIVLIERLGFEMKKRFHETELQVLVSPSYLVASDMVVRPTKDKHLKQGHLLLSAVQVRGHAMFSNEGRDLNEDTLEYAWMLEVQLGKLSGKLTLPQLCHVVTGLETLVLLTIDSENELRPPKTLRYCHHGVPSNQCQQTLDDSRYRCPSSEDIKYRMTRVSIDAIDLYLIESGTALHTWISPIRISTCNLHGQQVKSGITGLLPTILLRHFVSTSGHFNHAPSGVVGNGNSQSNTNTTGSGRSAKLLQHQNSKGGGGGSGGGGDDKKEDLNLLFKRDESSTSAIKSKKESDYGLLRKESKEKEDTHNRRSRDGGRSTAGIGIDGDHMHHQRRDKDDIYSSIYSSTGRDRARAEIELNDPWLEVGCVSLGPIVFEAASALPIPEHCLHLVQHNYLKTHDMKGRRLHFLWSSTPGSESMKCGCVGGCAFFGSNRNGLKFFKPSAQDLQDGVNIARYHIHPNPKEYGFGQSLLHEGQLVFHTPPYSLQSVTLQECYEYINKGNIRTSRHCVVDSKSPLPQQKHETMTHHSKHDTTSPGSTLIRHSGGVDKMIDKTGSLQKIKERDVAGSPLSADRRSSSGRRYSYTNPRPPLAHDVPYARLLDSPSKILKSRDGQEYPTSSPNIPHRQESITDCRLMTPKTLKIMPPKTSASDSRLTVEYFHGEDEEDLNEDELVPETMSHSAPQPNPLETDSEHSFSPRVISEETIARDVQRTISLTSENPSEAFFSADEDIHTSRSSSLKTNEPPLIIPKKRFASDLSIGGPNDLDARLSTHRSDYEIHTPEHRSLPTRPQSTAELNDDERRIHGLATPLRKISNLSPRPEFRHIKPVYDIDPHHDSSSDSPSISSNSFISALSSQEDITLVDLHMQVNRPIVDSPLLMASYVTHLAQARCTNWSHCTMPYGGDAFSVPLFQQNEDGGLVYIGGKLVPHFDTCSNWREVRIISRSDSNNSTTSSTSSVAPKSHPWDPSVMVKGASAGDSNKNNENKENEFIGASQGESATRNSVVVRFKGQVDVMLTPLLLEGLQRMVESLTPTLSSLHSLTVVNYLHGSCVRKVEAVNILKRDQSLSYWSQVHSNSKRSTAERNLQGPGRPVLTDVYEESISTQLQGLIVLPKINVSLIQTSVVEEVISFAALDNVHDLTCTSLLAVCFESVSTRFHFGKTTKASMHTVYVQPAVRSNGFKKGGIIKGTRALWAHLSSQSRPDNIPGEPVLIETSEKQLEELVITLDVGKAHAQLRRLKNEGCALPESQTIVTAIPNHRSRALFECSKYPEDPNSDSSSNGFIMFECGLEGVCVRIVKRSQFEKSENNENNLKAAEADSLIDANQSSVTTNNPLNISIETTASSAAAKAADFLKIGIKKPSTPKPNTPKDKLMAAFEPQAKEMKEKLETTPKIKDEDLAGGCGKPEYKTQPSTSGVQSGHTGTGVGCGSNQPNPNSSAMVEQPNDNGKTSSCVIDFKTVWFNFAAPPRVPITRKIDYTRLDWNLLSTASPAISAWMNPSNRFAIKVVAMMKVMYVRRTAVAACLMADVLEQDQSKHRPPKSRYSGKFTPLAKTLQEDPSCQLCTIMQKYVNQETVEKIEYHLKQPDLPQLTTLRQGVIVLSRQWKNTLYNPMLFEHQYKNKLNRPFNVPYPLPGLEEDCDDVDDLDTEPFNANQLNDTEENEHSMLLGNSSSISTRHHVIQLPEENPMLVGSKYTDSVNTSPSATSSKVNRKKNMKANPPGASSSRSSIPMFPIISGLVDKQDHQIEYGALRDGSQPSLCSSNDSVDRGWTPPPQNAKEDLYSWMAKQQVVDSNQTGPNKVVDTTRSISPPRIVPASAGGGYLQDSTRLIDAHLIFEPLLTCLGVMPRQMVNSSGGNSDIASLENLGTNLSLVGSFDTMRIDIVVSETTSADKKSKPKPLKKANGKFSLVMPAETPAFLCERVGVELEVLKMTDQLTEEAKQHVLYLSRGQLKKHTSTVINFSLNVRYISQQVNMPLLRLLHQITNMYQNVKEAQNELREQPEIGKRNVPGMKDESSLASEIHEPTLTGSLHEQLLDSSLLDERYDKFNESTPLGNSANKGRVSNWSPLITTTPSPSTTNRNRPQTFAQKFIATGKTVKGKLGYTNLNEQISTPIKASPTASTFEQAYQKSFLEPKNSLTGATSIIFGGPLINEAFTDVIPPLGGLERSPSIPKCWKTIYHLLELYAAMPETKTITHRVSLSPDANDHLKITRKYNLLHDSKLHHRDEDEIGGAGTPIPVGGVVAHDRTRLVVFGIVKIHRTRLLATLSGLKLEAEITALQSSATWRKKSRPATLECSLTGQVGRSMIVLLEGVAPNQQTVVRVTFGKSQTLYSSLSRRGKDKNSGLLTIGPINIDIPQHPVALHGMMTRSSKQLSSTLQELRVTRTSARLSRQNEEPDSPLHPTRDSKDSKGMPGIAKPTILKTPPTQTGLLQPLVMQFNVVLQSLSITAALLPSLQAQYKMDHVTSTGVTGGKAKFVIDLPNHFLSFTTKIQAAEANLPSEACIALPPVHVSAEYISEHAPQDAPIDGVVLRQGGYVAASAEIGTFERCLTTDLLNHLVFVQKVFMKEVNEVVQKVYGGEKPVPLWSEESQEDNGNSLKRILFNLNIRMKRIQLTATTPCSSAVRFETGVVELQLSNRVKNIADGSNTKLFGKAQIDLNLSLGQIIKNALFDEAEPEFQQYAFFNTTIGLRNAFQNEMLNEDKELVLITLKRPLIYVQPIAVDKAILVWLNYKNAYEYWTEKRANLNKEVLTATQQVFEKVPFGQFSQHLNVSNNISTLFLQLTVEDMGICLPLKALPPPSSWSAPRTIQEFESRGAVVITLENTIISACNSGSLVSKGRFVGLCLRFADDFETSLDDWKPNMNDSSIMNLCVVSEGTYEVCSRTIAAKQKENAKWFLNVKWQMEGVDIHLDVNIGKQLSALGHTLTMLTGSEEEEDPTTLASPDSEEGDPIDGSKVSQDTLASRGTRRTLDNLPDFIFDTTIDSKKRSMLMEREMNEQFKIIADLRSLGASHNTIAYEERRLQELQAVCYKYFRREMIQKWKRPSMRRPLLRPTNRSRSFVVPSPTREDLLESDNGTLDTIFSNDGETASLQSSPHSGPSRSASVRIPTAPRVTFNDSMRQSSLPSADSEVNFSDEALNSNYDYPLMSAPPTNNIVIDGEQVELRKKSISHTQKQQEPNIDFELDIKVLVNSGKCVLHTKEMNDEKISVSSGSKHHRRQQSTGTDWGSPVPSRRNKDKQRRYNTPHSLLVDLTIFHIPGLDVKLHYDSKTLPEEISPRMSAGYESSSFPSATTTTTASKKVGSKRASLFAWIILQSIPEETIISPHILEFLEQTLEPIPSNDYGGFAATNPVNIDLLQSNYVAYASFPVDVIVYFHMQPSTFRFSCLPVSRVECMLQLPSLDIVFSSKRHEDDSSSSSSSGGGSYNTATNSTTTDTEKISSGGLSVTGCLADFNVYIFHPYGGKKAGGPKTNTGGGGSGGSGAQFSPLADSERKDSLSINVEFVKFHLARSKKTSFESTTKKPGGGGDQSRALIRFSTIVDIGSASFKYDMRRLTEILAFPKAWYRHSIVRRLFLGDLSIHQTSTGDIDMTPSEEDSLNPNFTNERSPLLTTREKLRLSLEGDIPKRSGVGDTTTSGGISKKMAKKSLSIDSTASPSEPNQTSSWETLVLFALNFTKLNVQMNMGNVMGNVVWLTKAFRSDGRLNIGSTGHKNMYIGVGLGGSVLDAKGGIVGGTIELNKIDTYVHIHEQPGMEPHHKVGVKLNALELRLDYMGTSILMTRVSALNATLRDEWKNSKDYNDSATRRPAIILIHGDLSWDQLQMMISKSTTADLLKMLYKLEEFFSQQFKSSKRVFSNLEPRFSTNSFKRRQFQMKKRAISIVEAAAPSINANRTGGDGGTTQDARHHRHWQKPLKQTVGLFLTTLGVPLPNSGTVLGGTMELHGHNISLACFHGINFKSKYWALFSLREPCINFATEAQEIEKSGEVHVVQTLTFGLGMSSNTTPQHHSMASVYRVSRNIIFPPQFKTLHEWFHYAFANSDIDGIDNFPVIERDREINTNSIERARATGSTSHQKLQDPKHHRELIFAFPSLQLHFKTEHLQGAGTPEVTNDKPVVECSFITEFEDHIFVTVDADTFFFLHDLITSYLKEKEKVIATQTARSASPNPNSIGQQHHHHSGYTTSSGHDSASNISTSSNTSSPIPTAVSNAAEQANATTMQSNKAGGSHQMNNGTATTVSGSVTGGGVTSTTSVDSGHSTMGGIDSHVDVESFLKDFRHFNCKTWHLEPTVRLHSFVGKSIEPYGIDYILNKLGFSHARTTIPKWLQRGFMDPLDKVEAMLMIQLLSMVRENRNQN